MELVNVVVGCMCIITVFVICVFAKWMNDLLKECDKPTEVKIKLFDGGQMPEFKHKGDVCLDCRSRIYDEIPPKSRKLIPLGFALELPENYEAVVRPRSGLTKDYIDIGIGSVDTSYRGEVMACVINDTDKNFLISKSDRICQLAIREVPEIKLIEVTELSETERNTKGFGSSGLK